MSAKKQPCKMPIGKPRREPSGTVKQVGIWLTPTVYAHCQQRGGGSASRGARLILEQQSAGG